MARSITCKNEDGMEVIFTDTFTPFLLEDCEGLYSVQNNVVTSENTMTDGSTYHGSTTQIRNIVLTLRDHPSGDHEANRTLLYDLFKSKVQGTLIYRESPEHEPRFISYVVESVSIDATLRARQAIVSLLCPDPYFVGPSDIIVTLSGWDSLFCFPHEFLEEGEKLGIRVEEKLKIIRNTSTADNIGIQITITATGEVVNPSIHHVEQEESITIGTALYPLTMALGDRLIITTGTNNKHVYRIREGVQTEINEYLSEDSEFIQLQRGSNTIGYSAEQGEANMSVEIAYRYRYSGV